MANGPMTTSSWRRGPNPDYAGIAAGIQKSVGGGRFAGAGMPGRFRAPSYGDALGDPNLLAQRRDMARQQAAGMEASGLTGAAGLAAQQQADAGLVGQMRQQMFGEGMAAHRADMDRANMLYQQRAGDWQRRFQPYELALRQGIAEGQLNQQGDLFAHQRAMQGEQLAAQQAMQQAGFGQQTAMQQAGFGQQSALQAQQLANQRAMQQAGFGQQTAMQQAGFEHAGQMQANQLAAQQAMQQAGFGHQRGMQQAGFGQQTAMQQAGFGHALDMQGRGFEHARSMQDALFGHQRGMQAGQLGAAASNAAAARAHAVNMFNMQNAAVNRRWLGDRMFQMLPSQAARLAVQQRTV